MWYTIQRNEDVPWILFCKYINKKRDGRKLGGTKVSEHIPTKYLSTSRQKIEPELNLEQQMRNQRKN